MNQFEAFFIMGFDHISDFQGYDHMLFIIVLCSVYRITEWRKVAILVTAFTIGHSVTLALSSLKIVVGNPFFVELLIPFTILLTSIHNLFYDSVKSNSGLFPYLLALVFGFVHGLGFSFYFTSLLSEDMIILLPLFAFNLGLEMGQFLVVIVFFLFYLLIDKIKSIKHKEWTIFFSGAGAGMSIIMMIQRAISK